VYYTVLSIRERLEMVHFIGPLAKFATSFLRIEVANLTVEGPEFT
jgi:hypothetical protein